MTTKNNYKFLCKKGKNKNYANVPDSNDINLTQKPLPRIRVCVRKRPPNKKEIQNSDIDILEIKNGSSLTVKELK